MPHPRTAIRKKAVELLMGNTSAGASVYASRVAPFIVNDWDNQLPAISVSPWVRPARSTTPPHASTGAPYNSPSRYRVKRTRRSTTCSTRSRAR
ncbi:hypothetical protein ACE0DR_06035 [Azotobacter sp. CWF10]